MARFLMRQSASSSDKPWNYDLVDDVLIEIFLRLPVRSLLLLKSVSKHWLALIQSPMFTHLYNNRPNHINNPILLVQTNSGPELYNISFLNSALTILSDDHETTPTCKDDMALEVLAPSIYYNPMWFCQGRLLAPCNGLFCITDTVDVVIFNPATKQCREVPRSPLNSAFTRYKSYYDRLCFGFDNASSDYKVVRFRDETQLQYKIDQSDHHRYYMVQIFSLKTNSWTQVNRTVQAHAVCQFRNYDLFLNNAVHWFGCGFNDICSIVVYDLNKEAFKLYQLPDDNFTKNDWVSLSVLDEFFTLILHKDYDTFQIWAMKEYGIYTSWKRLYNINVGTKVMYPLSFGKDGEVLFEDLDRELVSFNLKTKEMKKLEVKYWVDYAFRYSESLVSLKRSKGEECESGKKM